MKRPTPQYAHNLWDRLCYGKAWKLGTYSCYEVEGNHPLRIIVLEDSMEEGGVIPTLFLETEYPEYAVSEAELFGLGRTKFQIVESAFINHVCNIPLETKRFNRYRKQVNYCKVLTKLQAMRAMQNLRPLYEESWKEKDIEPFDYDETVTWANDLLHQGSIAIGGRSIRWFWIRTVCPEWRYP